MVLHCQNFYHIKLIAMFIYVIIFMQTNVRVDNLRCVMRLIQSVKSKQIDIIIYN